MTENASIATEAREKMIPYLMEGCRKFDKYFEGNSRWCTVDILDGFGAHHNTCKLIEARYDNRILSIKEEGALLYITQAYDNLIAKNDK